MIKPAYGAPIDRQTLEESINLLERMMTLLHPFMPFITEEIWHQLRERVAGDDCVISKYPQAAAFDAAFIEKIELAKGIVSGIRDVRNNNGLKQKELLKVFAQDTASNKALLEMDGVLPMVVKMASLESLEITSAEISNGVAFLVGNGKFFVELEIAIDVEEERKRLQKELEYYQGFVKSVQNKLSNEKFVSGAPAEVVNKEKQKLADGEMKMKNLAEELAKLG
jgi:valyl-tRNA synthetase